MLYTIGRLIFLILAKLFFGFKVIGADNIPKTGGFLFASNHVSNLDPILMGAACPRKINYMAKNDLFRNRFFAWILSAVHVFPVKRESADLGALKEAIRRLKSGNGLLVFPEGRRSAGGLNEEPQPGVGFLAAKCGVPIIPAFISGTEKALPKHAKRLTRTSITIRIGEKIFVQKGVPYLDSARNVMEHIRHLSCARN